MAWVLRYQTLRKPSATNPRQTATHRVQTVTDVAGYLQASGCEAELSPLSTRSFPKRPGHPKSRALSVLSSLSTGRNRLPPGCFQRVHEIIAQFFCKPQCRAASRGVLALARGRQCDFMRTKINNASCFLKEKQLTF